MTRSRARSASALRPHTTLAPELRQMPCTVSPPRPAGETGEALGSSGREPASVPRGTGATFDGDCVTPDTERVDLRHHQLSRKGPMGGGGAELPIILPMALWGTQSCSDTGVLSVTIWWMAAFARHTRLGDPEISSVVSSPSSSSSTWMRAPVSWRSCGGEPLYSQLTPFPCHLQKPPVPLTVLMVAPFRPMMDFTTARGTRISISSSSSPTKVRRSSEVGGKQQSDGGGSPQPHPSPQGEGDPRAGGGQTAQGELNERVKLPCPPLRTSQGSGEAAEHTAGGAPPTSALPVAAVEDVEDGGTGRDAQEQGGFLQGAQAAPAAPLRRHLPHDPSPAPAPRPGRGREPG